MTAGVFSHCILSVIQCSRSLTLGDAKSNGGARSFGDCAADMDFPSKDAGALFRGARSRGRPPDPPLGPAEEDGPLRPEDEVRRALGALLANSLAVEDGTDDCTTLLVNEYADF